MPDSLEEGTDEPQGSSRRVLLGATAGIAGLMGAMVAVPVGQLFAAPLLERATGESENWVPTGVMADEVGTTPMPVEYDYQHREGWYEATKTRRVVVSQPEPGKFVVLDTECTHVGCGVIWQPEEQRFFCPCHAGVFDAAGNPVSGPPPTPLKQLSARKSDLNGQLEVKES